MLKLNSSSMRPWVDRATLVAALLSVLVVFEDGRGGFDTIVGPALFVILCLLPLLLVRRTLDRWAQTRRSHLEHTRVLMSAVDAADPFTRDHSYRVSRMSVSVGRQLGLRAAALEELEFAALVHDLGRTALQRDVLVKRGKLTAKELQHLQAHPRVGAELLAGERHFPGAAEIVLSHHEQPDGGGYPRGLRGDAVPMASRVIMVVAAFDAMTSDRPYRRGLSPEQAFDELLAHGGTQFFPDVVEALIRLYADGRLFAEFDEAHIERYRRGEEHSRAVEGYLGGAGSHGGVPAKAGVAGAAGHTPTEDLPVIEFPAAPATPARLAETIALGTKGAWRLETAAQTDLGCGRSNNEDSFGVFRVDDARGALLVLADGMGGAAAGEVASRLAVDTLRAAYAGGKAHGQPREALSHALSAANRAVHARAAADPQLEGMGSTCTVAAIVGNELTLGHVGDSRAYLVHGGTIEQLTLDHTLAGELARVAGAGGAAAAVSSHVLTRCIGGGPDVQADISPKPIALADGAALVLCSDGLSNEVEGEEIREIVATHDPAAACEALVELARARGGADNITVVVGRMRKG